MSLYGYLAIPGDTNYEKLGFLLFESTMDSRIKYTAELNMKNFDSLIGKQLFTSLNDTVKFLEKENQKGKFEIFKVIFKPENAIKAIENHFTNDSLFRDKIYIGIENIIEIKL